jgi:hypothetical protein
MHEYENPRKAGAERVRVTKTEPGRECKSLGDAAGSQGNRFTAGITSDANFETGARHDLKNKVSNGIAKRATIVKTKTCPTFPITFP